MPLRPRRLADLGLLDDEYAQAIVAAFVEIRSRRLHDQFVVDAIQGWGRHVDLPERERSDRKPLTRGTRTRTWGLHEHVKFSQSTNDVYPRSVKRALSLPRRYGMSPSANPQLVSRTHSVNSARQVLARQ